MKKSYPNIDKLQLILLLGIYLLSISNLCGQNLPDDSARHYLTIAKKNWHNDIKIAHDAAKNAYLLIPRIDNSSTKADIFAQYGVSFYTNQKYDSAIKYYQKALETANKEDPNTYRFISYLCSALEKKGQYKDVFNVIENEIVSKYINDEEYLNLLFIKLSAALKIGLTAHSVMALKAIEEILPKLETVQNYSKYLNLKGLHYKNIASFQKSDSIFLRLIDHYDTTNNKMDKAETLLFLAQNAMEVSRYKESSKYLIEAQAIYDSLDYGFGQANIDLFTGSLLSWMQRYNEASNYIFQALKVFEENNNVNEIQMAYYELGWIFYSLNLEDRAKKYLNQSIKIARAIQNLKYLGAEYNALASLYADVAKFDSAIIYYDSAIFFEEQTNNIKALYAAKFNKAVVLEKIGKDLQALALYQESYKVDLDLKNQVGLIEGELVLGNYFMKNDRLDSAKYYLDLGEARAVNLGEKYLLLKILQAQADLHSTTDEFKTSSQYLRRALEIQKQLAEETKTLELATLETTYNLKNKEKELALLNLQKQNNEQTIKLNQKTIASQRNTVFALIIGIVILLILSYIIFRYLKIRTKINHQLRDLNFEIQEKQEEIMAQSEELKEANDHVNELNEFLEKRVSERTTALEKALSELDHFFYRASHDFRGPLTTLLGLVEISKAYNLPQEATDLFNKVNITVKKLDGMVKKLQAVSFLGDFENLKSPHQIELAKDIKKIADEVIHNKSFDGINHNCELRIQTGAETVLFYPSIIHICLSNLIENSLVFNYSAAIVIDITATEKEGNFILKVQDNGIGISQDMQDDIFNMFKRTSQISTGNGLGLYIVKKAVDQLNGEIQITSDTRKGTTFTLIFPLSKIEQLPKKESTKLYISK